MSKNLSNIDQITCEVGLGKALGGEGWGWSGAELRLVPEKACFSGLVDP